MLLAGTLLLQSEGIKAYFPLNTGDKWVYDETGDTGSMRVTDIVGDEVKINGFPCIPVISSSNGKELDRVYYTVGEGQVMIVAFKEDKPLKSPYAIIRLPELGSKWSHNGETMMGDAPADLELEGNVKKIGQREFDGKKVDAIEVRLKATLLEAFGTGFTVEQVAVYGKGIGLISMEMTTKLPKRSIKSQRKLVSFTPKTSE